MKIQCDGCEKEEAAVFCTADEAALCDGCNHQVHHANKLASKHLRFSLQHPSAQQCPLCDICQKRRAFVFCKDDRAILCRECDVQIHRANQHTQRHHRFLLTGVMLSSAAPAASTATASYQSCSSPSDYSASNHHRRRTPDVYSPATSDSNVVITTPEPTTTTSHSGSGSGSGPVPGSGTSSISEYLTQTIPGWRVEDLLDPYSSSQYGFNYFQN